MNKNMAIFLISIGSILLIIGMGIALKTMKPMYFNVLSGFIILVGTFFGLFGKQLQDKNSSEKSDKLLARIETQAEMIDRLRNENTDLYAQITGGDSYCYLNLSQRSETNTAKVSLIHEGKNPLSKIKICMHNTSSLYPKPNTPINETNKKEWSYTIESLEVGDVMTLGYVHLPNSEEEISFSAGFSARNGSWQQQIIFRKIDLPVEFKRTNQKFPPPYKMKSQVYKLVQKPNGTFSERMPLGSFHSPMDMDVDWKYYKMHIKCDGMIITSTSME